MRAGAREDQSQEEVAGCTSCLSQGAKAGKELEETYFDPSLLLCFNILSLYFIGQNQQLAGQQGILGNVVCKGQLCKAQNRSEKEKEYN